MTRVRCVLRFAALDHVEVDDAALDLLTEHDLAAALDQVQPWPVEEPRDYRRLSADHHPAAAAMVAAGLASRIA